MAVSKKLFNDAKISHLRLIRVIENAGFSKKDQTFNQTFQKVIGSKDSKYVRWVKSQWDRIADEIEAAPYFTGK